MRETIGIHELQNNKDKIFFNLQSKVTLREILRIREESFLNLRNMIQNSSTLPELVTKNRMCLRKTMGNFGLPELYCMTPSNSEKFSLESKLYILIRCVLYHPSYHRQLLTMFFKILFL